MDLLLSQRRRWDQCWYISRNQKAPKSLVISLPYQSRPVEFLANFLQRWGADKEEQEKGSLPGQDGVIPVPHPAQVSYRSIHTQLMQRPVVTALSSGVSGVERRGGQRAAPQRECLPAEAQRSAEGTRSSPLCF